MDRNNRLSSFSPHILNASGGGVQRPAKVTLDVLAWRHHLFLLAAIHPIRADTGVQMDVDLVEIDRNFPGFDSLNRAADGGQTPVLRGFGQGPTVGLG